MRVFLKKNWLGLFGLLIGLIGIVLSFIFYTGTLADREPVFVVDPNRTEIISADRVSEAPLKVVRTEGGEISGNISSVRVYLWNRGKISIKPENILQPLRLTLGEPKGEILDFKILKISREVVTPEITRYPEDPKRVLSVNFKILEQDDGFSLQIIYIGSPSTDFTIDGQVEGVPYRIGSSQIEKTRFWLIYLNKVKIFGITLLILVAYLLTLAISDMISDHFKDKTSRGFELLKTYLKWGRIIFFAAMLIVFFTWVFIITPVKNAKKEARQSLVEGVPSSIVSHKGSTEMPNE